MALAVLFLLLGLLATELTLFGLVPAGLVGASLLGFSAVLLGRLHTRSR